MKTQLLYYAFGAMTGVALCACSSLPSTCTIEHGSIYLGSAVGEKSGEGPFTSDMVNHRERLALMLIAIEESGNPDLCDDLWMSALAHAAAIGDTVSITRLLERGINLHTPDFDEVNREDGPMVRETHPILLALQNKQWEAVSLLLRGGMKPIGADTCVALGNVALLCEFLRYGASVSDGSFSYPPYTLLLAKTPEMAAFLMSQGCSLEGALKYAQEEEPHELERMRAFQRICTEKKEVRE